jgi:hypothetical protein
MKSRRIFITLPLLLMLLGSIAHALKITRSDLQFTAAETELSFWSRQNYVPPQASIDSTRQDIAAALNTTPENPDYLDVKARLLAWQAYRETDQATSRALTEKAMATRLLALERRPAYRRGWVKLVGEKARQRQFDDGWRLAMDRIALLRVVAP